MVFTAEVHSDDGGAAICVRATYHGEKVGMVWRLKDIGDIKAIGALQLLAAQINKGACVVTPSDEREQ